MKAVVKTRELQAKKTRDKLLKTSIELIVKRGYDDVTVSEICRKCKVAKGTFYTYFDSKQNIVNEILAENNRRMFKGREWNDSLPTIDRLMEYIDVYLDNIKSQGLDFNRLFFKVTMDQKYNAVNGGGEMHWDLVVGILRDGQLRGEIRKDVSVDDLANMLMGFMTGVMYSWCNSGGRYDIINEGRRAVLLFLDMMKPQK